jgi:hypothetical protein
MEGFDGPVAAKTETLGRIVAVLEKAGVEFLDEEARRKAQKEVDPRPGEHEGTARAPLEKFWDRKDTKAPSPALFLIYGRGAGSVGGGIAC